MRWFPPHVPVAARRARVARVSDELRRNGVDVQPIHIEGRSIARSFWGRRWCHHLESCSDFENRLPRGRAYVRNGSVCHLDVHAGGIDAMVVGSDLYHVVVRIRKLGQVAWKAIRAECAGRVGSVLELLQGRLSDHVLRVVTDPDRGLFPKPGEITLTCDCPDWAVMCKHAAAVLYGVGSRLDDRPELLFRLRDVDAEDLVVGDMALPGRLGGGRRPRRRSRGHLRHRSRPGGQRRGGRSAADHRTPPAPPREAASDRRPAVRVPAYGPPGGGAAPPGRILGPRVRRPAPRIRVDGVPLGSGLRDGSRQPGNRGRAPGRGIARIKMPAGIGRDAAGDAANRGGGRAAGRSDAPHVHRYVPRPPPVAPRKPRPGGTRRPPPTTNRPHCLTAPSQDHYSPSP